VLPVFFIIAYEKGYVQDNSSESKLELSYRDLYPQWGISEYVKNVHKFLECFVKYTPPSTSFIKLSQNMWILFKSSLLKISTQPRVLIK
jgi:hypothetical protein